MNYIHLTIEERACISKFKEMKMSLREMAKILNRNISTISRELRRNSYKMAINYSATRYSPTIANNKYVERRINCHRPIKATNTTLEYIKNKIKLHWSPDQIINRKDETVTNAIIELLKDFPKEAVKTITCDWGKEFAGWRRIEEELQTNMYFANPYCAWQKGTNENSNGLLREFYPKQMDLSKTDEKEVQNVLKLLNNRPRKCINYKTPQEWFDEYLNECCTWFDKLSF